MNTTHTLALINKADETHALEKLKQYYQDKLIPAEKKEYLTDLKESIGPYMGIESANKNEPHFLLDAGSQIATLGMGFNALPFFGASHHIESWNNDLDSANVKKVWLAYRSTLARQLRLPPEQLGLLIRHSGAEANETALGYCYRARVNKGARKVMAFEGSFHGRMQVSLTATWNKPKREPFEWPGFEATFMPFPELKSDQVRLPLPEGWLAFWQSATQESALVPSEWMQEPLLKSEVETLVKVQQELCKRNHFAVIIEPMQCEGGDRYGSSRFFNALVVLARAFEVPVIFDEVQTGFHLGQGFFWHRLFDLKDAQGKEIHPNFVTCAKKAQVGLVLAPYLPVTEAFNEFSFSSLCRGYSHALAMEQLSGQIRELEKRTRPHLESFCKKLSQWVESPRCQGMAFAFDLKDKAKLNDLVAKRFELGLLYYPAGDQTLRFRLNTAFTEADLSYLFEALENIFKHVYQGSPLEKPKALPKREMTPDQSKETLYAWHELFGEVLLAKQNGNDETLKGQNSNFWKKALGLLPSGMTLEVVEEKNWPQYKKAVEDIQLKTYEKARQTASSVFEAALAKNSGFGVVLKKGSEIVAISFCGPVANFPLERGLRRSPHFCNPKAFYMIDTTVVPGHQGLGLGRSIKYLSTLLASLKGGEVLVGRNRSLMAGPMLLINASLGAVEYEYLAEDYMDFEANRDVIFYEAPLTWKSELNLSSMHHGPMAAQDLNADFFKQTLDIQVNKICLSNFVGVRFLEDLKLLFSLAPKNLQHGYTTSGQAECVDKIVKSIWSTGRKKNRLLTFKDHYFGRGSFLARALSQLEKGYFDCTILPHPDEEAESEILEKLEAELKLDQYLAIFLEPVRQNRMDELSESFLQKVLELGRTYKTPVVFNETASSFYRFGKNFYAASESMAPDAIMTYFGGQAGLCYLKPELYVEKPLMLISTWDGDEYSTHAYAQAVRNLQENLPENLELRRIFQEVLLSRLTDSGAKSIVLQNGRGSFRGPLPLSMQRYFRKEKNRFLVNPTFAAMKEFIAGSGE